MVSVGVAVAIACGDPSHIFQGNAYIDGRDCLGTTASVDVVTGDDPGFCDVRCLAQPEDDGGRQIYISTMCPPDPVFYDASGSDPACPKAIAALYRNDICNVDGITSSDPIEAGPDTGAADASDQ